MLGEALEDLESCGQSELLRELEVLSPGQEACGGIMSRHTGGLGKATINGVMLVCHLGMCSTYMSCGCDKLPGKGHLKRKGWGWR